MQQIPRNSEAGKRRQSARSNHWSVALVTISCCALLLAWVALPSAKPLNAQSDSMSTQHSYNPPQGFIPDSITAVRVAEAVLVPVYGAEQIERQKPLTASLRGDVWVVKGQLRPRRPGARAAGGVALVEIAKKDGRILRMTHGR
jgi:hypothetical protein